MEILYFCEDGELVLVKRDEDCMTQQEWNIS